MKKGSALFFEHAGSKGVNIDDFNAHDLFFMRQCPGKTVDQNLGRKAAEHRFFNGI
jgi:hypothetical protein